MEDAIVEYLGLRKKWVSRREIQDALGIISRYGPHQNGFLIASILDKLQHDDDKICRNGYGQGHVSYYRIKKH